MEWERHARDIVLEFEERGTTPCFDVPVGGFEIGGSGYGVECREIVGVESEFVAEAVAIEEE